MQRIYNIERGNNAEVVKIYNQKELGEKIKRERGNSSLESLAEKINISRQTLARWEKGEGVGPSVFDLLRMCDVFKCDFGYLVGEYDCRTRKATDIQKETGLTEGAIKSFESFKLYGDDMLELLSSLLVDGDFFFALSNLLIAQEWENKPGGAPFIITDADKIAFLLPGQWEDICSRGKREAIAFYMQEAQSLFRKAAEKAIKTQVSPRPGRE